jgi:hypothetical protein
LLAWWLKLRISVWSDALLGADMRELEELELESVTAGREKTYIATAAFVTYRDIALEMFLGKWKSPRQSYK